MRISGAIAVLLLAGPSWALPPHAPWPGGIAVVELGDGPAPEVRLDGRAVLVTRTNGQWHALVGIPLDRDPAEPLVLSIRQGDVTERTLSVPLQDKDYRVQRLTVEPKYVDPGREALDRIAAERRILDPAIANWRPADIDDFGMAAPVPGARSSSFGSRRVFNDQPRSPHRGMDMASPSGTPILAPLDGVVTVTGDFYFNGNTVIVDHGQGLVSLYCHLSEIGVEVQQNVAQGDRLGAVGATGRVTGAHLHFATYLNGTAVDPALLLVD